MLNIDSYAFTDKGGRSRNEDSVLVRELPCGTLFIVADGLGGHSDGDLASGCVTGHFGQAEFPEGADPAEWLASELEEANRKLAALKEEKHSSMKTTFAGLMIAGGEAFLTHIGDSRIYHLHDSSVFSVTEDHSVAFKKFRSGEITYEQIGSDEDQSSLLRTVGSEERFLPENDRADIAEGDGFLLCSDGLWEYVRREEVLIDMLKAGSAREWAELMLLRYMERAGDDCDNISLIAVMIG